MYPSSTILPALSGRWSSLCRRLGRNTDPGPLFDELVRAYSEPHRHYHTLDHISQCLSLLDTARPCLVRPDDTEWAVWLHDVVYDSHAHDNEEHSARRSASMLRSMEAEESTVLHATELILATRHEETPQDNDARYLVDIDLAVLGAPPGQFDAYEQNVRREYEWVPEERYRAGRRDILLRFLNRGDIYSTPEFRSRFEQQARANLLRSVQRLGGEAVDS